MKLNPDITTAQEDAELVLRYRRDGDMDALGRLFDRYMELVYGVCLKYMGEPEDAKDAVVDIFEELVTKLKKYEVDAFRGWLYQVSVNHCLMKLRSRKRSPAIISADRMQLREEIHLEEAMENETRLHQLEECLRRLPQGQQDAVRLFYLERKCYREVAEQLGEEVEHVRSHLQNGRRNLRICMERKTIETA